MTVRKIGSDALRKLCGSGLPMALLDVRDPVEVDRGHVPGMTNIPRNRIEFRIAHLVPDPSTALVLYCDGESGRSALAAKTLAGLGYGSIWVLDGGLKGWEGEGAPTVTGNNVPSKRFGEVVNRDHAVPAIKALALNALMQEGKNIAVCDVRTPGEHAEACIPGGVSLPSFDIALHAQDLARSHDLVVLHCAGRTRSIIATRTLCELGMDNVVALENGTIGWHLAGLLLRHGAALPTSAPQPSAESAAYAERRAREIADAAGIKRITPRALQDLLAQEGVNRYVFDVRSVDEYLKGHIRGSLALPGGQAVQRMDDFIALRGAPIVLAGQGEAPANLTAAWLSRMGCTDVAVLTGGLDGWTAAGGSLHAGSEPVCPLGWERVRRMVRMVSVQELSRWLADDRGVLLLDVDHSANFRKGHVAGAHWLPRAWLEQRIHRVAPDLKATVVLASADGRQACYAAATLAGLGYEHVWVLDGGSKAWAAAGMPVEKDGIGHQDDELLPPYKRGVQAMHDYIHWETQLIG